MDIHNNFEVQSIVLRFVLPVVGCIAAAILTVYIMQEVNPLAAGCVCLSVVLFSVAVVSPSSGLVVLLFVAAYSDLLKRMLVLLGELSLEQVTYVLAVAPLVVMGLFVAAVTRWAFHKVEIKMRDVLLTTGIAVVSLVSFFLAQKAGSSVMEALKAAANNGLYMLLMPTAMKVIQTPDQIGKFLRYARLIFVPVACYGIFQAVFGLADFEVEYLRSGLTIMVKELFDVRPRPFSTLNAASTFGAISAMLAVLSLHPWLVLERDASSLSERMKSGALMLLYTAAAFASVARASFLVWVIALFALWGLATPARMKLFYTIMASAYLILIALSPYLLAHLAEWDPANDVQSNFAGQVLRLQTYSDRLRGFVNLTHSTAMYSWFGLPEEEKLSETTYQHDPVSSILVDTGVVGLSVFIFSLVVALRFIHRRLLSLPAGFQRQTALMLIALEAGLLGAHLLFHALLGAFPVNVFFWVFAGMLGFLLFYRNEADEIVGETVATPAWASSKLVYAARLPVSGRTTSLESGRTSA
jgi:hypothetical protein